MPDQGTRPCDRHVGQANGGRAVGGGGACRGRAFSIELLKIACSKQIRSIRIVAISVFEYYPERG